MICKLLDDSAIQQHSSQQERTMPNNTPNVQKRSNNNIIIILGLTLTLCHSNFLQSSSIPSTNLQGLFTHSHHQLIAKAVKLYFSSKKRLSHLTTQFMQRQQMRVFNYILI
jgi:hypothetical protein